MILADIFSFHPRLITKRVMLVQFPSPPNRPCGRLTLNRVTMPHVAYERFHRTKRESQRWRYVGIVFEAVRSYAK